MQLELLYTTFPELQAAEKTCKILLDERLIACANLIPGMTSLYRWQGKVENTAEIVAILKTDSAYIEPLMARLKELHPYDVPCIMNLKVGNVDVDYLGWLINAMSPDS